MSRNPAERPTAQALVGLTSRLDVERTTFDAPSAAPHTKPLTAVAAPPLSHPRDPRDFRGQLPPAPPPPQPQPSTPRSRTRRRAPARAHTRPWTAQPEEPKPYGLYRVLSLILLAGAVGLAMVLPSIAVIVVLLVMLLLRTADRAHQCLTSKRTRRGPRPSDVIGVIVRSPFSVVRAGLAMAADQPARHLRRHWSCCSSRWRPRPR